jgi:nitrite reductase/ring-hydroxylating ferredoxin subunit
MKRPHLRFITRLSELPPGTKKVVAGGPFGIGVFNVNGTLHALINRCPHAGAQVCRGRITGTTESPDNCKPVWIQEGEILRCPWHGWEFEIATGRALTVPDRRLKKYPVHVSGGEVLVELPYSYGKPEQAPDVRTGE